MNKLAGLMVLVTRPQPAGEALSQEIREQGGIAINLPTIEFGNAPVNEPWQEKIALLNQQDWLIFVSPHAVKTGLALLQQEGTTLPSHLKLAAVGSATAQALTTEGYHVDAYPAENQSSEGLLALRIFENVAGKRIMIVRGEGGRETLENNLRAKGAMVTPWITYRRLLPTLNTVECDTLCQPGRFDVVVTTSYEGVKNFKILAGDKGWSIIQSIPLIVVSERVKLLAMALGFQTIWVAKNASHAAIIEILSKRRNDLCRIKSMNLR